MCLPHGSRGDPSVFCGEIACWKPDPPAQGTKAQRCRCCFGDRGHVIECRSILGTIIRISTHSPWYMAEDLRFESAGGVARSVKMPGYLTLRNSTQYWTGWQQDNRVEKPTSSRAVLICAHYLKAEIESPRSKELILNHTLIAWKCRSSNSSSSQGRQ